MSREAIDLFDRGANAVNLPVNPNLLIPVDDLTAQRTRSLITDKQNG